MIRFTSSHPPMGYSTISSSSHPTRRSPSIWCFIADGTAENLYSSGQPFSLPMLWYTHIQLHRSNKTIFTNIAAGLDTIINIPPITLSSSFQSSFSTDSDLYYISRIRENFSAKISFSWLDPPEEGIYDDRKEFVFRIFFHFPLTF